MEENGRVTVKRVERPDGMTEYSLEYIPPIMISDGKYLKEERLKTLIPQRRSKESNGIIRVNGRD